MPASIIMAEVGLSLKVSGSKSATPAMEPRPGKAPTMTPMTPPARAKKIFTGSSAWPKPVTRLERISMLDPAFP
jgi:hypothetical protein